MGFERRNGSIVMKEAVFIFLLFTLARVAGHVTFYYSLCGVGMFLFTVNSIHNDRNGSYRDIYASFKLVFFSAGDILHSGVTSFMTCFMGGGGKDKIPTL